MWSFDVFFDLRLNKWLRKNRDGGDLRRHRAHYDDPVIEYLHMESISVVPSFWKIFRITDWRFIVHIDFDSYIHHGTSIWNYNLEIIHKFGRWNWTCFSWIFCFKMAHVWRQIMMQLLETSHLLTGNPSRQSLSAPRRCSRWGCIYRISNNRIASLSRNIAYFILYCKCE